MFSLKIVDINYYVTKPIHNLDPLYSNFRGSPISKVPVIQIFGTTPTGQKCCLHLHGAFPYILVPYDGSNNLSQIVYHLAQSLDKALNISFGKTDSNAQHVFNIIPVSGKSLYGFHDSPQIFLKIFFYNPCIVKKAVELLQSGAILNKVFQPFEAHVPYVLQFMIDNNVHGMNFIHVSSILFRRPVDYDPLVSHTIDDDGDDSVINNFSFSDKLFNLDTVPSKLFLPHSVAKISVCQLEADALVGDVTNKRNLTEQPSANPGLAYIWEDEMARQNVTTKLTVEPPSSPPRDHSIVPSESQLRFKEILKNKLQLQKPSDAKSSCKAQELNLPLQNCFEITASPFESTAHVLQSDTNETNQAVNLLEEESFVNESIILSMSQNINSSWMDSQDKELLDVLGKLSDGSQVKNAQDHDATLSSQKLSGSNNLESGDESSDSLDETVVMSQRIWMEDPLSDKIASSQNTPSLRSSSLDVEDFIPQFDGGNDFCLEKKRDLQVQKKNNYNKTLLPSYSSHKDQVSVKSKSHSSSSVRHPKHPLDINNSSQLHPLHDQKHSSRSVFSKKSHSNVSQEVHSKDHSHRKHHSKGTEIKQSGYSGNVLKLSNPIEFVPTHHVNNNSLHHDKYSSGSHKSKHDSRKYIDSRQRDSDFQLHGEKKAAKVSQSDVFSEKSNKPNRFDCKSHSKSGKKYEYNTDILKAACASFDFNVEVDDNIVQSSFEDHLSSSKQTDNKVEKNKEFSKVSHSLSKCNNDRDDWEKSHSVKSSEKKQNESKSNPTSQTSSIRKTEDKHKKPIDNFDLPTPLEHFSDPFNDIYDCLPQTPGNFLADGDADSSEEEFDCFTSAPKPIQTQDLGNIAGSYGQSDFNFKSSEIPSTPTATSVNHDVEVLGTKSFKESKSSEYVEVKDQNRSKDKKESSRLSKKKHDLRSSSSRKSKNKTSLQKDPESKLEVKKAPANKMKMLFGSPSPPRSPEEQFCPSSSPFLDRPPTPGGEEIFLSLPDDPLNLATITENFDPSFKQQLRTSSNYFDDLEPSAPYTKPPTPKIHSGHESNDFYERGIQTSSSPHQSSFHSSIGLDDYPSRPLTPGRESSFGTETYPLEEKIVESVNTTLPLSTEIDHKVMIQKSEKPKKKLKKKDSKEKELKVISKQVNQPFKDQNFNSQSGGKSEEGGQPSSNIRNQEIPIELNYNKSKSISKKDDVQSKKSISSENVQETFRTPIVKPIEKPKLTKTNHQINLNEVPSKNTFSDIKMYLLESPAPMTSPMPFTPAPHREDSVSTNFESGEPHEFDFNRDISKFHVSAPVSPLAATPFVNRSDYSMDIIPSVGYFTTNDPMSPLPQTPLHQSNFPKDMREEDSKSKNSWSSAGTGTDSLKADICPSTSTINATYSSVGPLMSPLPPTPAHYRDLSMTFLKNNFSPFPMTSPIPDTPKHYPKIHVPVTSSQMSPIQSDHQSMQCKDKEDSHLEESVNESANMDVSQSDPTIEAAVAGLNFEEPPLVELPSAYSIEIIDRIEEPEQDVFKEKSMDLETEESESNNAVANLQQPEQKEEIVYKATGSSCPGVQINLQLSTLENNQNVEISANYPSLELNSELSDDKATHSELVKESVSMNKTQETDLKQILPSNCNESTKEPIDLLQTICEESFGTIAPLVPDDLVPVDLLTAEQNSDMVSPMLMDVISNFPVSNTIQLSPVSTVESEPIATSPSSSLNSLPVSYFEVKPTESKKVEPIMISPRTSVYKNIKTVVIPQSQNETSCSELSTSNAPLLTISSPDLCASSTKYSCPASSTLLTSLVDFPTICSTTNAPQIAYSSANSLIPECESLASVSTINCDVPLQISNAPLMPKLTNAEYNFVAPTFSQTISTGTVPHSTVSSVLQKDWSSKCPATTSISSNCSPSLVVGTGTKLEALLIASKAKFSEKQPKPNFNLALGQARPFVSQVLPVSYFGNNVLLNSSAYSNPRIPLQTTSTFSMPVSINNNSGIVVTSANYMPLPGTESYNIQGSNRFGTPKLASNVRNIPELMNMYPTPVTNPKTLNELSRMKEFGMTYGNAQFTNMPSNKNNVLHVNQQRSASSQFPTTSKGNVFPVDNCVTSNSLDGFNKESNKKQNAFASFLDEAHNNMIQTNFANNSPVKRKAPNYLDSKQSCDDLKLNNKKEHAPTSNNHQSTMNSAAVDLQPKKIDNAPSLSNEYNAVNLFPRTKSSANQSIIHQNFNSNRPVNQEYHHCTNEVAASQASAYQRLKQIEINKVDCHALDNFSSSSIEPNYGAHFKTRNYLNCDGTNSQLIPIHQKTKQVEVNKTNYNFPSSVPGFQSHESQLKNIFDSCPLSSSGVLRPWLSPNSSASTSSGIEISGSQIHESNDGQILSSKKHTTGDKRVFNVSNVTPPNISPSNNRGELKPGYFACSISQPIENQAAKPWTMIPSTKSSFRKAPSTSNFVRSITTPDVQPTLKSDLKLTSPTSIKKSQPSPLMETDPKSVDSLGSVTAELTRPFSGFLQHSAADSNQTTPTNHIRVITDSPLAPSRESSCVSDTSQENLVSDASQDNSKSAVYSPVGAQTSPLSLVLNRQFNDSPTIRTISRQSSTNPTHEIRIPMQYNNRPLRKRNLSVHENIVSKGSSACSDQLYAPVSGKNLRKGTRSVNAINAELQLCNVIKVPLIYKSPKTIDDHLNRLPFHDGLEKRNTEDKRMETHYPHSLAPPPAAYSASHLSRKFPQTRTDFPMIPTSILPDAEKLSWSQHHNASPKILTHLSPKPISKPLLTENINSHSMNVPYYPEQVPPTPLSSSFGSVLSTFGRANFSQQPNFDLKYPRNVTNEIFQHSRMLPPMMNFSSSVMPLTLQQSAHENFDTRSNSIPMLCRSVKPPSMDMIHSTSKRLPVHHDPTNFRVLEKTALSSQPEYDFPKHASSTSNLNFSLNCRDYSPLQYNLSGEIKKVNAVHPIKTQPEESSSRLGKFIKRLHRSSTDISRHDIDVNRLDIEACRTQTSDVNRQQDLNFNKLEYDNFQSNLDVSRNDREVVNISVPESQVVTPSLDFNRQYAATSGLNICRPEEVANRIEADHISKNTGASSVPLLTVIDRNNFLDVSRAKMEELKQNFDAHNSQSNNEFDQSNLQVNKAFVNGKKSKGMFTDSPHFSGSSFDISSTDINVDLDTSSSGIDENSDTVNIMSKEIEDINKAPSSIFMTKSNDALVVSKAGFNLPDDNCFLNSMNVNRHNIEEYSNNVKPIKKSSTDILAVDDSVLCNSTADNIKMVKVTSENSVVRAQINDEKSYFGKVTENTDSSSLGPHVNQQLSDSVTVSTNSFIPFDSSSIQPISTTFANNDCYISHMQTLDSGCNSMQKNNSSDIPELNQNSSANLPGSSAERSDNLLEANDSSKSDNNNDNLDLEPVDDDLSTINDEDSLSFDCRISIEVAEKIAIKNKSTILPKEKSNETKYPQNVGLSNFTDSLNLDSFHLESSVIREKDPVERDLPQSENKLPNLNISTCDRGSNNAISALNNDNKEKITNPTLNLIASPMHQSLENDFSNNCSMNQEPSLDLPLQSEPVSANEDIVSVGEVDNNNCSDSDTSFNVGSPFIAGRRSSVSSDSETDKDLTSLSDVTNSATKEQLVSDFFSTSVSSATNFAANPLYCSELVSEPVPKILLRKSPILHRDDSTSTNQIIPPQPICKSVTETSNVDAVTTSNSVTIESSPSSEQTYYSGSKISTSPNDVSSNDVINSEQTPSSVEDENELSKAAVRTLTRSKGAQKAYPEDFALFNKPSVPTKKSKAKKKYSNLNQSLPDYFSTGFQTLPSPMTTQSRKRRTCASKSYSQFFDSDISSPAHCGPVFTTPSTFYQLPVLMKRPRGRPRKNPLVSSFSQKTILPNSSNVPPIDHYSPTGNSKSKKRKSSPYNKETPSLLSLTPTKLKIKLPPPSLSLSENKSASENTFAMDNESSDCQSLSIAEPITMPSNPRDPLGIETLENPKKKRKLGASKKSNRVYKCKSKNGRSAFQAPPTPMHSSYEASSKSFGLVPYTPVHRIDYRGPGTTPASYHETGLKIRLRKKQRKLILRIKCPPKVDNARYESNINENIDTQTKPAQQSIPPLVIKKKCIKNFPSFLESTNSKSDSLQTPTSASTNCESLQAENSKEIQPDSVESSDSLSHADKHLDVVSPKLKDVRMPLKIKIKTTHDQTLQSFSTQNCNTNSSAATNQTTNNLPSSEIGLPESSNSTSTINKTGLDFLEKELAGIFGSPNKQSDKSIPENKILNDEELNAIFSPSSKSKNVILVSPHTTKTVNDEVTKHNSTQRSDSKLKTPPKVVLSSLTFQDLNKWKNTSVDSSDTPNNKLKRKKSTSGSQSNKKAKASPDACVVNDITNIKTVSQTNRLRKKVVKNIQSYIDLNKNTAKPKNKLIQKYETSKEIATVTDLSIESQSQLTDSSIKTIQNDSNPILSTNETQSDAKIKKSSVSDVLNEKDLLEVQTPTNLNKNIIPRSLMVDESKSKKKFQSDHHSSTPVINAVTHGVVTLRPKRTCPRRLSSARKAKVKVVKKQNKNKKVQKLMSGSKVMFDPICDEKDLEEDINCSSRSGSPAALNVFEKKNPTKGNLLKKRMHNSMIRISKKAKLTKAKSKEPKLINLESPSETSFTEDSFEKSSYDSNVQENTLTLSSENEANAKNTSTLSNEISINENCLKTDSFSTPEIASKETVVQSPKIIGLTDSGLIKPQTIIVAEDKKLKMIQCNETEEGNQSNPKTFQESATMMDQKGDDSMDFSSQNIDPYDFTNEKDRPGILTFKTRKIIKKSSKGNVTLETKSSISASSSSPTKEQDGERVEISLLDMNFSEIDCEPIKKSLNNQQGKMSSKKQLLRRCQGNKSRSIELKKPLISLKPIDMKSINVLDEVLENESDVASDIEVGVSLKKSLSMDISINNAIAKAAKTTINIISKYESSDMLRSAIQSSEDTVDNSKSKNVDMTGVSEPITLNEQSFTESIMQSSQIKSIAISSSPKPEVNDKMNLTSAQNSLMLNPKGISEPPMNDIKMADNDVLNCERGSLVDSKSSQKEPSCVSNISLNDERNKDVSVCPIVTDGDTVIPSLKLFRIKITESSIVPQSSTIDAGNKKQIQKESQLVTEPVSIDVVKSPKTSTGGSGNDASIEIVKNGNGTGCSSKISLCDADSLLNLSTSIGIHSEIPSTGDVGKKDSIDPKSSSKSNETYNNNATDNSLREAATLNNFTSDNRPKMLDKTVSKAIMESHLDDSADKIRAETENNQDKITDKLKSGSERERKLSGLTELSENKRVNSKERKKDVPFLTKNSIKKTIKACPKSPQESFIGKNISKPSVDRPKSTKFSDSSPKKQNVNESSTDNGSKCLQKPLVTTTKFSASASAIYSEKKSNSQAFNSIQLPDAIQQYFNSTIESVTDNILPTDSTFAVKQSSISNEENVDHSKCESEKLNKTTETTLKSNHLNSFNKKIDQNLSSNVPLETSPLPNLMTDDDIKKSNNLQEPLYKCLKDKLKTEECTLMHKSNLHNFSTSTNLPTLDKTADRSNDIEFQRTDKVVNTIEECVKSITDGVKIDMVAVKNMLLKTTNLCSQTSNIDFAMSAEKKMSKVPPAIEKETLNTLQPLEKLKSKPSTFIEDIDMKNASKIRDKPVEKGIENLEKSKMCEENICIRKKFVPPKDFLPQQDISKFPKATLCNKSPSKNSNSKKATIKWNKNKLMPIDKSCNAPVIEKLNEKPIKTLTGKKHVRSTANSPKLNSVKSVKQSPQSLGRPVDDESTGNLSQAEKTIESDKESATSFNLSRNEDSSVSSKAILYSSCSNKCLTLETEFIDLNDKSLMQEPINNTPDDLKPNPSKVPQIEEDPLYTEIPELTSEMVDPLCSVPDPKSHPSEIESETSSKSCLVDNSKIFTKNKIEDDFEVKEKLRTNNRCSIEDELSMKVMLTPLSKELLKNFSNKPTIANSKSRNMRALKDKQPRKVCTEKSIAIIKQKNTTPKKKEKTECYEPTVQENLKSDELQKSFMKFKSRIRKRKLEASQDNQKQDNVSKISRYDNLKPNISPKKSQSPITASNELIEPLLPTVPEKTIPGTYEPTVIGNFTSNIDIYQPSPMISDDFSKKNLKPCKKKFLLAELEDEEYIPQPTIVLPTTCTSNYINPIIDDNEEYNPLPLNKSLSDIEEYIPTKILQSRQEKMIDAYVPSPIIKSCSVALFNQELNNTKYSSMPKTTKDQSLSPKKSGASRNRTKSPEKKSNSSNKKTSLNKKSPSKSPNISKPKLSIDEKLNELFNEKSPSKIVRNPIKVTEKCTSDKEFSAKLSKCFSSSDDDHELVAKQTRNKEAKRSRKSNLPNEINKSTIISDAPKKIEIESDKSLKIKESRRGIIKLTEQKKDKKMPKPNISFPPNSPVNLSKRKDNKLKTARILEYNTNPPTVNELCTTNLAVTDPFWTAVLDPSVVKIDKHSIADQVPSQHRLTTNYQQFEGKFQKIGIKKWKQLLRTRKCKSNAKSCPKKDKKSLVSISKTTISKKTEDDVMENDYKVTKLHDKKIMK